MFKINLSPILSASEPSADFPIPGHEIDLGTDKKAAITGKVAVTGTGEGTALGRFDIEAKIQEECSRCLTRFARHEYLKFAKQFAEEPIMDELQIENDEVDIDPALYEEITVREPITILDRPDCKGLCLVCGKNWNNETCEHMDLEKAVPEEKPFAALKKKFRKKKR